MRAVLAATFAVLITGAATAAAEDIPQPPAAGVEEVAPPTPVAPAPVAPTPEELARRIDALEERADRVPVLERRIATLHERVQTLLPLRRFLTVFVDLGWFSVGGNGAGVRSDIGHRYVPDYENVPAEWVLLGDPLSTTINSLGEPADLGVARSIEDDSIDSGGHPTFLVNALGLAIGKSIGDRVAVAGLVELLPRPGPDRVVVELAHVDYRPSQEVELLISAGKVDSVLGIEYRAQDARDRVTVTPSLLCRYTCGRPYGVRARAHRGPLDASAALTTGDTFEERFEADPRIASSALPTVSAHLQLMLPIGNGLELGASGAIGPQDGQSATHVHQWHYGLDLRLHEIHDISLQAEFVHGRQQGSTSGFARAASEMDDVVASRCDLAPCLSYKAAYALASWRARARILPYARVDWRDARHHRGIDFLYVSRVVRATVGLNVEVTNRVIAKIEYTNNHELLGPQFPNDVLTTSLVVSTD